MKLVIRIPGDEKRFKEFISKIVGECIQEHFKKHIKKYLADGYMAFLSQNIHKINADLMKLIQIRGNLDGYKNSKAKEIAYFE